MTKKEAPESRNEICFGVDGASCLRACGGVERSTVTGRDPAEMTDGDRRLT